MSTILRFSINVISTFHYLTITILCSDSLRIIMSNKKRKSIFYFEESHVPVFNSDKIFI